MKVLVKSLASDSNKRYCMFGARWPDGGCKLIVPRRADYGGYTFDTLSGSVVFDALPVVLQNDMRIGGLWIFQGRPTGEGYVHIQVLIVGVKVGREYGCAFDVYYPELASLLEQAGEEGD